VRMGEAKRELIWIRVTFFMGWGCSSCGWKDLLPRDVPTAVASSAEAEEAFEAHKCARTPDNNRKFQAPIGFSGSP